MITSLIHLVRPVVTNRQVSVLVMGRQGMDEELRRNTERKQQQQYPGQQTSYGSGSKQDFCNYVAN